MKFKYNSISILGTDISQVRYDDALVLFQRWVKDDRSAKTVVAANVHLVTEASLNSAYDIYASA